MTALYIPNIIERGDDEIEFQHLNITQGGTLVSWTFVARAIGEGYEYPELGVLSSTGIFVAQLRYAVNMNCTYTPHPNVYECGVTPLPVEAGDFISLRFPPLSNARLLLSFILNGAPPGFSFSPGVDELVEGLPLITLGMGKSPLATLNYVTYSSTVPLPSSTHRSSSVVSGFIKTQYIIPSLHSTACNSFCYQQQILSIFHLY